MMIRHVRLTTLCKTLLSTSTRLSSTQASTFKFSDIEIERTTSPAVRPPNDKLVFGKSFSDHMLQVKWDVDSGWHKPQIVPLQNLSMHPAATCLHYGVELFEGMKAYRCVDDKIRMYRPWKNAERMLNSAEKASLPMFDRDELIKCMAELIRVDQQWVPDSTKCSLYIRPTFIGTGASLGVHKADEALLFVMTGPVGPYFPTGAFNPVSLYADTENIRAWIGGAGDCKLGGNYGPTIRIQDMAQQKFGCQQVLWLYGEDHQVTEVGTMNLFCYWINESGEKELITAPLNGIILPGVTRDSILHLTRQWGEFKVSERVFTMAELVKAVNEERVIEMFGAGTASVVCPVNRLLYLNDSYHIPTMENGPELASRLYTELTDIQYGRVESEWMYDVC